MGINYVHSGLLAAVGIQLPAVQLGPQELRPGPEGRTVLREIWASPGVWEKKEKKGCQEPIGCPCWGGPRTVKEPHSQCGRKEPVLGSREDRMERALWFGVSLTG